MQTLYVPKYQLTYRVNPKNPCELQWSKKPFGPMTSWQHAYTFSKPIRALDTDDQTGQGVVVLNDSSTYVGSGVRVWGKKFYTAGSRIYSLYSIGESKMTNKLRIGESKMANKLRIKVHEKKGNVDLDAMMSEFKQALGGGDFKMQAYSEPTKYGVQHLVIKVQGVGEFVCSYELVYNGGSFKIRTWDADSTFDLHCDLDVFHKLKAIFNRYCEG